MPEETTEAVSPIDVVERFNEVLEEMKTLDEKYEPGKAMDDADQSRWDELEFEADTLKPEVDKLEDRARKREEIGRRTNSRIHGLPEPSKKLDEVFGKDVTRMDFREARDWSLRVLNDKESNWILPSTRAGDLLEQRVRYDGEVARRIVVTENDHYRTAWGKLVTQATPVLSPEENQAVRTVEQFRTQIEGQTTQGGFALPVFIDPSVILTNQETNNPFLSLCRIENVTTNQWKGVSAAGVVWSFDNEAAEVSDDSITLAQPTVAVNMARGFIPYSIEVGEDWPGFQAEMARLLAEGYSELQVSSFTTGTGVAPNPTGVLTALVAAGATSQVTVTTDGAFGVEDVYKIQKSLAQKYRGNASWMSSVDVNNKIRAFGGSNVYHGFTVALPAGAADQILGRPWYENPYFPDFTGTTGAANLLVFGDFSNMVIARRTGMSVELVPHLVGSGSRFPLGMRGWFAYGRIGSNVVNAAGLRVLVNT